jgi:hypothetical protein
VLEPSLAVALLAGFQPGHSSPGNSSSARLLADNATPGKRDVALALRDAQRAEISGSGTQLRKTVGDGELHEAST